MNFFFIIFIIIFIFIEYLKKNLNFFLSIAGFEPTAFYEIIKNLPLHYGRWKLFVILIYILKPLELKSNFTL